MLMGLEHRTYRERLRQLGLVHFKKRRPTMNLVTVYKHLIRRQRWNLAHLQDKGQEATETSCNS